MRSVARERTKHSNCSLPLGGPGRAGPGGVLEFVWCKRLEHVTAAAQEMLDMLRRAHSSLPPLHTPPMHTMNTGIDLCVELMGGSDQ